MVSVRIMIKLVFLSILAASLQCCNADVAFSSDEGLGWSCDPRLPENSTTVTFKANVNSLLKTLKQKGPENHGFDANTAGNKSDKVYGLVQCMGNISVKDCARCLKDSINLARERCKNSNDVAVWLKRCYLRYSDGNFIGQWNTSTTILFPDNSGRTDSPSVAVRGQKLMRQLSYNVTSQPFLFKIGSIDVGKEGKRYGLVQCNRDLNKSSCSYCIEDMLGYYSQWVDNHRSYMMISYGCRMWYDSYEFYLNDTRPIPNGRLISWFKKCFSVSILISR